MTYTKRLLPLTLVICLFLTLFAGCQEKMPEQSLVGKDSIFNEELSPEVALLSLFSDEKYGKLNDFMKTISEATTPIKADYNLKINTLQIKEGLSLNNSNKLSGSFVFGPEQVEGNFDASILGNKIVGNLSASEDEFVIELPELLDKFLKLPTDTSEIDESNINIVEMPTQQELTDFGFAMSELYKKAIAIIKDGIPNDSVETSKVEVEYNVEADVVKFTLKKDELQKIITEMLDYIKGDARIEKVMSKFINDDKTFNEHIDEIKKQFEQPDESSPELLKLDFKATFIKSKLSSFNVIIEDSKGKSEFSLKYKEENGVKRFIYKEKNSDGYTIDATYAENTATNEYTLTVTDTINSADFILTFKVIDENNFFVNLIDFGADNTDITIKISFSEISEKKAAFTVGVIVNENVDIELELKTEILDSYKFTEQKLTADNTFDFSDPKQAQAASLELGKSFEWLYELIGMTKPSLPEHEITFDETRKHNTEGKLMIAAYNHILDGDGTMIATTRDGVIIRYDTKDNQMLYTLDGEEEIVDPILYYFNGTEWLMLDEETNKLVKQEGVTLWLAEVMLFVNEAEFISSGYANVDGAETYYEVFYYPTFESELCFLYDLNGNPLYLYDGTYSFDVGLYGSSSNYITQVINQYS